MATWGTFVAGLPQVSDRLRTTIDDIDAILTDPQVKEIIANIDAASADAGPAMTDVRKAVQRLDRLIATQEAAIDAAVRELAGALSNIQTLTEDAKQNPSRLIFGDPPPETKPGGSP